MLGDPSFDNTSENKTVFLVEDHPGVRKQLGLIATHHAGLKLAGEAASAEAALESLEDTQPGLFLIDISLPGMNGLEFVEALHARYKDCRCLIVSGHVGRDYVAAARRVGANGFVSKGDPDELLSAVAAVLNGNDHWPCDLN